MSKSDASARQGHYKANTLNTQVSWRARARLCSLLLPCPFIFPNLTLWLTLEQDSRMRRHEVTIELRKSKKEDQMFKRRNINDEDLTSPLKELNGQSPVQLTVDEIVAAMNSEDPDRQFLGMQQARKMLSRERNPPIDLMIGHGIVPICIRFLQNSGK